jgi:HIRAN domain
MGLFKKKQPRGMKLELLELCGDGYLAVVGESHYQDALRRTASACTPGEEGRPSFQAVLVSEPNNPYDANAIAVLSTEGRLGYLSREDAIEYREVLAEVKRQGSDGGACIAHLNGGVPGKPSYGVTLLLAHPDKCLRELRDSA